MKSKKLTGSNHPDWRDMSNYVVHFTKPSEKKSAYRKSLSILGSRRIKAMNSFGLGRHSEHALKCVCFSEIPPGNLARLADARGSYGIAFRKDLVVEKNGGPILYAYKDTTHASALRVMLEVAKHQADHPLWHLAPFIDMPGDYPNGSYFFEWEREWRHPYDFKFKETDAAFLIIPEESHAAARSFFAEAEGENTGPNYTCPFIDPYWSAKKVAKVLSGES